MSAFQVNITPTRNKIIKSERQPIDVILAPFSAKAIVTFEDVPVLKTARRILNIINTTDEDIKVMLTRSLNPEYNACLEWTSAEIPPNGCKKLEIVWNPTNEIVCRETIQFTDNRNFRKDVSVVLKSIRKTKNGQKRFPTLSSGSASKFTLKLKSQVPNKNVASRKSNILNTSNNKSVMIQKQIQDVQSKQFKEVRKQREVEKHGRIRDSRSNQSLFQESKFNFEFDLENKSPLHSKNSKNKENISPLTPENVSLFDSIKFTPATESKSSLKRNENPQKCSSDLDYLASLPTPVNIKTERNVVKAKPLAINFSPEVPDKFISNRADSSSVFTVISNETKYFSTFTEKEDLKTRDIPKIYIEKENERFRICQETYVEELRSESPGRTYIQDSMLDVSSEPRKSLSLPKINNKTFDLQNKTASYENISLLQNVENTNLNLSNELSSVKYISNKIDCNEYTAKLPTRLSSIAETEESFRFDPLRKPHATRNSMSPNVLKRDIKLIGTPLRKGSESLRDLSGKSHKTSMSGMGSMPDLNNMETLQSIEQNRYYNQQNFKSKSQLSMSPKIFQNIDTLNISNDSCVGNIEVYFNQNEIQAASSRFNINDAKIYKSSKPMSPYEIKQESTTPAIVKFKSPVLSPNDFKFVKRNFCEIDSPTSSTNLLTPRPAIAISISPPKRTKFNAEFSTNKFPVTESSLFPVVSWKSSQPIKKLRLQKSLSLVRKPITPRKIKEEPRQMLYNTENFLQHYINPDPFAATTTLDPFLASTMYLEEDSVNKYEIQFKKWLNALVSMPSEFYANCEDKIDVGHLFNEVRNKELILAPTKEEQSMNYLTKSRMEALRSAAINLFMSEEMRVICSKVAVYIKKGAIKIRSDRDLHLDVVMQRSILELLLCFNPLWLRLGLEVVFGEVIHLHSNSDIIGLSTFILNRLFRDKFIERKYSKAYTLSEEYRTHMKSFTLQKVLFLLIFLDKAKNNRIIKHNPCLFVKKSPHKETKEILLRISSELLASVGDITKELRRLGYVLSHKQCYIDEFDYAFKNLAVDLRDGVRLTKIMEIILLRDNLTNLLRCPAISRLQRIYNVNLALNALSDADFQLKGDITAYDIVDGHREKTLSLLWQIIYKFRSPKFIAAATTLQRWWRKCWIRVVICRRIRRKEEVKRNKAATAIQSLFRGYMTRKYVEIFKAQRVEAVICLQKYCRRYICRKRFIVSINSIIFIQRWYRNEKLAFNVRSLYIEIKFATQHIQNWYRKIKLARKLEHAALVIRQAKSDAKFRFDKALIIQRSMKSYIIRKKFKLLVNKVLEYIAMNKIEYRSAVKIQSVYKMFKLRREFLLKKHSALRIQQFWRSLKLQKIQRARFLEQRLAVIKIQSYLKVYLIKKADRQYYLCLRKSTICIQQRFRANRLCKVENESFKKLKKSCIIIQQHFRANCLTRKFRNDYKKLMNSTILIQSLFRAKRLCYLQFNEYQKLRISTITIQKYLRALTARRKYNNLKEKTIFIQRKLRATILSTQLRKYYCTLKYSTILIQRRFRANKCMLKEKQKYCRLKSATITIQQHFRAQKAMKKQRTEFCQRKQAINFIKKQLRSFILMKKLRSNFIKLRNSVLIIQRRYRANKLMQLERFKYQLLLRRTIETQKRFRANILMKKHRQHFLMLRNSAIIIQSRFRATKNMRIQQVKYNLIKKSTITIQQKVRAHLQMKIHRNSYQTLYKYVMVIQEKFRANTLMKKQSKIFLALKYSTILIQRKWRALQEMRKQKKNYVVLKNAAVLIQKKYRALKLMQVVRRRYMQLIQNVIYVQQLFKANRLMKKERQQYLRLHNAVSFIQVKWKALLEMRKYRTRYLELKMSAIIIQQRYRANKQMQIEQSYYENLYIFVLSVQQIYRAKYLMKKERTKYLKLKTSAIIVQKWIRSTFKMRKQKTYFISLKISCVKIQQRYRAKKQMLLERKKFLNLKKSVKLIENFYESIILMRKSRIYYLKLKWATCLIQKKYRSNKQQAFERQSYLDMKKSAIIIQRAVKSYIEMKRERAQYSKLKKATLTIQQRYRSLIKMRLEREKYLYSKEAVERFQVYCRGYLARKRFIAAMTPEMRDFIKQRKAAKVIQKYWRGYMVRKKWRNVRILVIREKIKELKSTANACNTVGYKISSAVKFLNSKKYNVQEELSVLLRLEKLSRTVPHFLMDHSTFIATFCYTIMAQAIRSEIDKQIIELCSRIILNLARYNSTTANTFQENGLVTIAQILLRWCDKECGIFNTLCTLVWVFSQCPIKNKIIRAFMTTPEAIYMLRETKKLVLRKEKMRQNVRRLSIIPSTPVKISEFSPKTLPSLEPDFGIIQGKPYTFISSVFALDVVLNCLGIKEIY